MIQEELQKLAKILQRDLILKLENFQSKLEAFTKLKIRISSALAFLFMQIKKNIQSMYQNNVVKKNMLTYYKHVTLLIGEEEKKHVLIKDFNKLMYDHSFHRQRKHFGRCLHAFIKKQIFKHHIKDCFKINSTQTIKMPKDGEDVKFKNFERKIKSPFMIYANFESTLVPEDNEKQNPNVFYTNKYQKHVACNYGYKLIFVYD